MLACFPQRGRPRPYRVPTAFQGQPLPMAHALQGETGTMVGFDSRGHRVLAAYAPFGGGSLGMNTKMDVAELYAPVREQLKRMLPLLALIVIVGIAWMRRRLRPLGRALVRTKEQAQVSEARFIATVESIHHSFAILEAVRDEEGRIRDFCYSFVRDSNGIANNPQRHAGAQLGKIYPDTRTNSVIEYYSAVVESGEPLIREIEVGTPEIAATWVEQRIVKHGDGVAVAAVDISERKRLEAALRASERGFSMLANNSSDMIFLLSLDGIRRYVSPASLEILGWAPEYLIGTRPLDSIHPDDADRVAEAFAAMRSGTPATTLTNRIRHRDGHWVWIEAKLRLIRDADSGDALEIQGSLRDISQRVAAETRERENAAYFKAAVDSSLDAFFLYDAERDAAGEIIDFRVRHVNANGERALGMPLAQLSGQRICELLPLMLSGGFFERFVRVATSRQPLEGEFEVQMPGGKVRWMHFQLVAVGDGVAATSSDITERKRAAQRVLQLAHYDSLTGLPNRALFLERLERALSSASTRPLAMMFVDVDRFKSINDAHGHAGGDDVLREVGERLRRGLRLSDTVARLGGDEFTVILDSVESLGEAEAAASALVAAMQAPVQCAGVSVDVSVSIGGAFVSDRTIEVDALMKAADMALYEVKKSGRGAGRVIDLGAGRSESLPVLRESV